MNETSYQVFSQIECEYNADILQKKKIKNEDVEQERTYELYILGLNTLQALMYMLRLQ